MLLNATLIRVDDPPPAAPGPAVSVRCMVDVPAGRAAEAVGAMGETAEAVLYLPMGAGVPAPTPDQRLTVCADGCPACTWRVACTAERVGNVLNHLQVFLQAV